jgi:hypothetical protein
MRDQVPAVEGRLAAGGGRLASRARVRRVRFPGPNCVCVVVRPNRPAGVFLRPAVAALVGEGILVAADRGDCPLGAVGARIGDPVPLFELVPSVRAPCRALPTFGVVTAVGLALLAAQSRSGA